VSMSQGRDGVNSVQSRKEKRCLKCRRERRKGEKDEHLEVGGKRGEIPIEMVVRKKSKSIFHGGKRE